MPYPPAVQDIQQATSALAVSVQSLIAHGEATGVDVSLQLASLYSSIENKVNNIAGITQTVQSATAAVPVTVTAMPAPSPAQPAPAIPAA